MKITRYSMDREGDPHLDDEGIWVEWDEVDPFLRTISQLKAQLKHNKDRDYSAGFEAGLMAGLNGG